MYDDVGSMVGSGLTQPLRIYLAHSLTDDLTEDVLATLRTSFEVVTSAGVFGSRSRLLVRRAAMVGSDMLVALVPPAQARGRQDVLVEIGIGVGLGIPVLLLARDSKVPSSMLGLPVSDPETTLYLLDDVRRAQAAWRNGLLLKEAETEAESLSWSPSSDVGNKPISRPTSPASSFEAYPMNQLILVVEQMLQRSGARTATSDPPLTDGPIVPDIVVWDDQLLSTFGLPLVVEVVSNGFPASRLRSRFRKTLKAAGATGLLAVSARPGPVDRWANGEELILTVSADDLDRALSGESLAAGLARLLDEAGSR